MCHHHRPFFTLKAWQKLARGKREARHPWITIDSNEDELSECRVIGIRSIRKECFRPEFYKHPAPSGASAPFPVSPLLLALCPYPFATAGNAFVDANAART